MYRTATRLAAAAVMAAAIVGCTPGTSSAGFVPDPSPTYQPSGTDHATATGSAKVSTCFLGICW
jgi:hypothetical protein